ncbi:MAG: DUF2075 domain-containing protein [Candidatus Nanopelagicales bacterium]
MPLLRSSAASILEQSLADQLSSNLKTQFRYEVGHSPSASEVRSWDASLPVLSRDLREAGLGDIEVLVEYQLPLSSKRADAVLCGTHPKTGKPSYLIVELKQWSQARADHEDPNLVYVDSYGSRPILHPGEQVHRYVDYICDFTRALERENNTVAGAAYLHNADESAVASLRLLDETASSRMFTSSQRGEWLEFLKRSLSSASAADSADLLLGSKVAPSRQLMALAADEIKSREQFVLLDEQQIALRVVLNAVNKASDANTKTAVVVTGGPGSGKSVIALSILGQLYREGREAIHATGSSAFTQTMRKVAGYHDTRVQKLFVYFNSFITSEKNQFDVLIADEAHRIRASSNNRYTKATARSNKPQLDELLDVARVPVFLLDEHQVVRPGEIGTVADIQAAARRQGIDVSVIELDAQFRAGGSRSYEQWVLRLLGLADGGPSNWQGDDHYSVVVVDSPQEMEEFLVRRQNEEYSARMSAGFCWPWSKLTKDAALVNDVVVGKWARPWNNPEEREHQGAPARSLWATKDGGFDQVGCIYTAQGFEYDWSGVIFGPDLVWRESQFVSDVRESRDPAFRGKDVQGFDEFVRNVYKVLLTRGMLGTVIYSTDAATREFLRELVRPPSGP